MQPVNTMIKEKTAENKWMKQKDLFRPSQYYKPASISEALSLLSKYGTAARPIAGGTDLMTEKDSEIKVLIDILTINLSYIKTSPRGLIIGATTTFSEIENSPLLGETPYDTLAYAASLIGTPQIRNMATIGGNICRPSPCADTAPVLLVLDAIINVDGPKGKRELPISEFFKGVGQDALEQGEIVTELILPLFPERTGTAFIKKGRVAVGDLSIVSVATCLIMDEQGRCKSVRIALGSVAPIPLRVKNAESFLIDKKPETKLLEEVAAVAVEEINPISDVRASAEYRKALSRTLVLRALQEALVKANQFKNKNEE
ncbi:MAG: xanthine dehydrogenase family protein subunit M [Spirochaetes bacterium]|nr:MAG: xanthine dehydrogenase family protein subunit M [Spirochaetota bacterium]